MWFVFPQLRELGRSATARRYGIASRAEAAAYLAHPLLGARLVECTALMLAVEGKSALEILGPPDDLKFRSSMTLFAALSPGRLVLRRGARPILRRRRRPGDPGTARREAADAPLGSSAGVGTGERLQTNLPGACPMLRVVFGHARTATMGILDILKQYADPAGVQPDRVGGHFDEVAQQSNPNDLGNGVAAAFRSDATPPFGQMVGDLFGRSDPQQRAGILNQILRTVGPGVLARSAAACSVASSAAAQLPPSAAPTITPAQASQISPADAAAIAAHAEQHDGSIVDKAGEFYAQHPALVKSLGAAALAIVLGRMHSGQR